MTPKPAVNMSCNTSIISSTWPLSTLVLPIRPNSLARNLLMACEVHISSPFQQRQGRVPQGVVFFFSAQPVGSSHPLSLLPIPAEAGEGAPRGCFLF